MSGGVPGGVGVGVGVGDGGGVGTGVVVGVAPKLGGSLARMGLGLLISKDSVEI